MPTVVEDIVIGPTVSLAADSALLVLKTTYLQDDTHSARPW